jgi:hypothetical protein
LFYISGAKNFRSFASARRHLSAQHNSNWSGRERIFHNEPSANAKKNPDTGDGKNNEQTSDDEPSAKPATAIGESCQRVDPARAREKNDCLE